jgi:hypothetical protein
VAGYAILLAVCTGHVALRRGDDLLSACFEFAAAVTLWSAVWASWCAPDSGPARFGSVLLVDCIAHTGFFIALAVEFETAPRSGCGLGSLGFILYPGIAIVMMLIALLLTGVGTYLVRCLREALARHPDVRARVVDSIR